MLLRGQKSISGPLSPETSLNDLATDYRQARNRGDARLVAKLRDQLLKYGKCTEPEGESEHEKLASGVKEVSRRQS